MMGVCARNMSSYGNFNKLHCCIKLAFHFISWWRCTVIQLSLNTLLKLQHKRTEDTHNVGECRTTYAKNLPVEAEDWKKERKCVCAQQIIYSDSWLVLIQFTGAVDGQKIVFGMRPDDCNSWMTGLSISLRDPNPTHTQRKVVQILVYLKSSVLRILLLIALRVPWSKIHRLNRIPYLLREVQHPVSCYCVWDNESCFR